MEYVINTHQQQEMVDITDIIEKAVEKSGINCGKVMLFCKHTTAGLTINENADPDVQRDIISTLNKTFPIKGDYKHFEGNSHAHLKASFMGASEMVLFENKALILGTWQSVFFCEFDGPRTRKVYIRVEA